MKTIKAGIIGTGFIGPAHVEAARRLGFVEMIALCEANDDLARRKAACPQHPESLRQRGRVARRHGRRGRAQLHAQPRALRHQQEDHGGGQARDFEKPLAMTTTESKELVALAAEGRRGERHRFQLPLLSARAGSQGDGGVGASSATCFTPPAPTRRTGSTSPPTGTGGSCRSSAASRAPWPTSAPTGATASSSSPVSRSRRCAPISPRSTSNRMKPKKEVETYSGKMLEPSDYEAGADQHRGLRQRPARVQQRRARVVHRVAGVSPDRKNRLFYELSGSKCSVVWDQERPNEMWIGYREKANELSASKDPSLLSPRARATRTIPAVIRKRTPDGLKNFMLRVYSYIAGASKEIDFSTFQDGHDELANLQKPYPGERQIERLGRRSRTLTGGSRTALHGRSFLEGFMEMVHLAIVILFGVAQGWLRPSPWIRALATTGESPYFILKPGYTTTFGGQRGRAGSSRCSTRTLNVGGVDTRASPRSANGTRRGADWCLAQLLRDPPGPPATCNYFGEDVDVYKKGKVSQPRWRVAPCGTNVARRSG